MSDGLTNPGIDETLLYDLDSRVGGRGGPGGGGRGFCMGYARNLAAAGGQGEREEQHDKKFERCPVVQKQGSSQYHLSLTGKRALHN